MRKMLAMWWEWRYARAARRLAVWEALPRGWTGMLVPGCAQSKDGYALGDAKRAELLAKMDTAAKRWAALK